MANRSIQQQEPSSHARGALYVPEDGATFRGFSSAVLKMIAVVTMFIDHAAFILLEPLLETSKLAESPPSITTWNNIYTAARMIGRLSFPIYSFLIVIGFKNTRSPRSYLLRMLIFAVLSEIPFNLAFGNLWDLEHQNVMWTFAISLALLIALEHWPKHLWLVVPAMGLAWLMRTDYHAYGVLLVFYLYLAYDEPHRDIGGAVLGLYQATAALAFVPIHFFNGEKGRQSRWFFYVFYPAHLLLLVLIRQTILS